LARYSEALRASNEDVQAAEAVLRSIETPLQTYNRELAELQRLLDAGRLSTDEFAAAKRRLEAELAASGNPEDAVAIQAEA
ncbi:hypothetical protein QR510_30400, partial [Escherichia coli]|uniref:hypothetical protein n=1 Tax=Escherichia coli TaxID=562 RepID=UPI002738ECB5